MAADQRLALTRLSGSGAAPGDTLVWDGTRWVPGASVSLVIVDDDEPTSPATGQLWYDTDDTC